jgi:hypothetical protein
MPFGGPWSRQVPVPMVRDRRPWPEENPNNVFPIDDPVAAARIYRRIAAKIGSRDFGNGDRPAPCPSYGGGQYRRLNQSRVLIVGARAVHRLEAGHSASGLRR